MVASPIKSKYPEIDQENIIDINEDLKLLKSVAIYGANSSGKTNLVKGLITMLVIIRDVMSSPTTLEQIEPFHFDEESGGKPSYFQLQFLMDGNIYRYGFEATGTEIVSEWLYGPANSAETFYFERESGKPVRVNKTYFKEGVGLDKNLKESNLFLNLVEALNGELAGKIKHHLTQSFNISLGIEDMTLRKSTLDMLKYDVSKNLLMDFLNMADFGIVNLEEHEDNDEDDHRTKKKQNRIIGARPIYNQDGEQRGQVKYLFDAHESQGTIKLFNYAGVILASIRDGSILIIDEFDARFHPMLTKKIVQMFNSTEINTKGAQLIFVTHDSNLLDNALLRRDQIYFAEKDTKGSTEFYALSDIKGVRNDASYEKDYIQGKYGGIPYLGDFNTLFDE